MSSQDNLFILNHDAVTGEITEIKVTEEELAREESPEKKAKREALATELALKESKKLAVLEKLGLTADEAAVLLG